MKRVCLIGCGGHAFHVYLGAVRRCQSEMPGIFFSACCDTEPQRAQDFADQVHAPRIYTDYRQMLEQEKPDAVILVTPYPLTAEIAGLCMRAGCAVLIEKPPAPDFSSCCRLAEVAQSTGCMNQVAFNRRHIPIVREMRRQIGDASISHIDYQMYRIRRTESHFYSTAVHGIDLVCWLAGSPCRKQNILYSPLVQYGDGVENILVQLAFSNGTTAQLSFCPVSGFLSESLTVTTDQGSYRAELPVWQETAQGSLMFSDLDGHMQQFSPTDGSRMFESNGFYWQLRCFFENLLAGNPSPDNLATVLETMRLTDLLREHLEKEKI